MREKKISTLLLEIIIDNTEVRFPIPMRCNQGNSGEFDSEICVHSIEWQPALLFAHWINQNAIQNLTFRFTHERLQLRSTNFVAVKPNF